MPHPRRHENATGETHGFAPWQDTCGGDINVVYARKGTPTTWRKVGEMCLRCHALWPVNPPAIMSKYREQELIGLRNREP